MAWLSTVKALKFLSLGSVLGQPERFLPLPPFVNRAESSLIKVLLSTVPLLVGGDSGQSRLQLVLGLS